MQKVYDKEPDEFSIDEQKLPNNFKLKQDFELFDDDSHVIHDLFSVRYVELANNSERWEIIKNDELVLVLNGLRFNKKERKFLRGPSGMSFIISGCKKGWKKVGDFKKHIKNQI